MANEPKLTQNYSYTIVKPQSQKPNSKQNEAQAHSYGYAYDAAGEETNTEEDIRYARIPKCILTGPAISSSDEESVLSENLIQINKNSGKTSSSTVQDHRKYNNFNSKTPSPTSATASSSSTRETTEAAITLLNDLKSLWLNVSAIGPSPSTTALCGGDYRIPHLLGLCSFIVKEMEAEWKSMITNQSDVARVKELQESNHLLIEQLEHSRTIQSCLESEVNSLVKEKVLMLDEIKELSIKFVTSREQQQQQQQVNAPNLFGKTNNPGPIVAIANNSESSSSFGFNLDAEELAVSSTSTAANNIKKRENDFDSIMEAVKERDNSDRSVYQEQMKKYDDELQLLQKQIQQTVTDNSKLQEAYQKVIEEREQIKQENDHYEIILKLILQEKQQGDGFYDLRGLLQNLLEKLSSVHLHSNCICDKKCCAKLAVVESALQLVQEQNGSYRLEKKELRDNLRNIATDYLNCKNELEESTQTHKNQIQQLEKSLHFKTEELEQLKKLHEENYKELNNKYNAVLEEKANVDKLLRQNETNFTNLEESFKDLQKANLKLQKKLQDAQRLNTRIGEELHDYKQNMNDLNEIINQLRGNLREQKIQWTERLRAGTEEITQTKINCKWLQSQVEHLNTQLLQANESLKIHERDKSCLAQQVLCAEEERKVVDRKLQELRTAFQGDTALREALMERNEALQVEINRLRKSNLMNLELNNNCLRCDESDRSVAPSEISGTDTISSAYSNNWSMDMNMATPTPSPRIKVMEIDNHSHKNHYSAFKENSLLRKDLDHLRAVASIQAHFKSNREIQ